MKKVYTAQGQVDAELVKSILGEAGIPARVMGQFLDSIRGEVGFAPDTAIAVWIEDDYDLERAMDLLARYSQAEEAILNNTKNWMCPKCGEILEGAFTECWQCGTSRQK
jgi:rubrerythrin